MPPPGVGGDGARQLLEKGFRFRVAEGLARKPLIGVVCDGRIVRHEVLSRHRGGTRILSTLSNIGMSGKEIRGGGSRERMVLMLFSL